MTSVFRSVVDRIGDALGDATVQVDAFRLGQAKLGAVNRIVFIPVGGTYDGPPSGAALSNPLCCDPSEQKPSYKVEALWSQKLRVHAVVRAESFERLEELLEQLLNAEAKVMGMGGGPPREFQYLNQSDQRYGHILGEKEGLLQAFDWDLVIVKKAYQVSYPTSQDMEIDPFF